MDSPASPAGKNRVAIVAAVALGGALLAFALIAIAWLEPELAAHPESAATHLRVLLACLALGGAACAFAIARAASSLAVARLSDVTRAAKAMRRDLGVRSGVRGDDEVGRIGEAVDKLAEALSVEKGSLQDDRDRLAAILDSMVEGVLVTDDANGSIVLANRALREMLLLDRTILGRSPLEAIRVAGLDDILESATEAPEGASGEIEITRLRPRNILVRGTPLRSRGAKGSHGLVVVFNDVTELRRLETLRRDFVANVSHELRTPIAAIRAASDTLVGGALKDPVAADEFVAIMARNAARLQNLVEDLLHLSRIEARQWKLELEPIDLRDVVRAAIDAVAAPDRRPAIENTLDVTFGTAVADRRALEQILVNLIDNAVKYAGPRAHVRIAGERRDEQTLLRVIDDGPGIERKHLPRLFERFYRVDAGRSRGVGGTGLGLSIVKHLVEAMGGTVDVESKVGAGTTFTVALRAKQPSRAAETSQ